MSVARIDKALGDYYKSVGRMDYFSNGNGLFMSYCEENDFDDNYVTEELMECSAAESSLIDFDNDFPLIQPMNDSIERNKAIFRILHSCNDYGYAYQSSDALDIWSVKLHMNEISEEMHSLIHFIKLKYFEISDLEHLPLLIVNGYIHTVIHILHTCVYDDNITYLIKDYYLTNNTNEPLLFRSLIMSILCLLQSDIFSCHSVDEFDCNYNRLTQKRYDRFIASAKREIERKPVELKLQKEYNIVTDISKYNWIDTINDSMYDCKNMLTSNNEFNVCKFEINLYKNDFDLNNLHMLFNKELIRNIQIDKNMLFMERDLAFIHGISYELTGPFLNFDQFNNETLKSRLSHFEDGKLYNKAIKWYRCYKQRTKQTVDRPSKWYDVKGFTSILYFGLLRNSFHLNTDENVLSVSFLVHRCFNDFEKRDYQEMWPTV